MSTEKPRLSVSTWSLNRTLGKPAFYGVGQPLPFDTHSKGATTLLELPAKIARAGIHTMEICHFHLPALDSVYLQELRAALKSAQVELFSLLIDDGDLTHPSHRERDQAWISEWITIASQLDARCVRVIAGKADPTPEALDISYQAFQQLIEQGEAEGVQIMTENWFNLLSQPAYVTRLLERLEGKVDLCFDFGNWSGPDKYQRLAQIAPYAKSCHAKASFTAPYQIDKEDYTRCLDITQQAGFSGPYTLIYADAGDNEWEGLAKEIEVVHPYLV